MSEDMHKQAAEWASKQEAWDSWTWDGWEYCSSADVERHEPAGKTCPHPPEQVSRRIGGDLLCRGCDTVIGNDGGRFVAPMASEPSERQASDDHR